MEFQGGEMTIADRKIIRDYQIRQQGDRWHILLLEYEVIISEQLCESHSEALSIGTQWLGIDAYEG